jgi:peptidoglycan/LPS O-acetylase OafA/YrhL
MKSQASRDVPEATPFPEETISPMHSISEHLARRSDNFLALRILAAGMVIYGHSFPLTPPSAATDIFLRNEWPMYSGEIAVGLFFVISGFMVSGSYLQRADLGAFVGARLLRIVPGLAFVLAACALVLGPMLTTLEPGAYFAHPDTWRYITQNLHFSSDMAWTLPGVFEGHRMTSVNGSLWTLPAEMRMYLLVALMGVFGLLSHRRMGILAIAALFLAGLFDPQLLPVHGDWLRLGAYFCAGIAVQLFKDRVQARHDIMLMLGLLTYISFYTHGFRWLVGASLAYFCFWFAYRTPRIRIERFGDPSYGIYLWGWPAQQVVVELAPRLSAFQNFLVSLVLAVVMGYVSWRLVEKPALRLKGSLSRLRDHSLVRRWMPRAGAGAEGG